MQRTFRPARHNLITAIWLGTLFGSIFIGCLVASVLDHERPFAWLGMAAFWLMWVLMVGYELLAYFRARLVIDGQRLVKQGVFSTRELLLNDSAKLTWRIGPSGGSVVAKSPTARLTILFSNLELNDRIALIEHLRNTPPEAQQTGWNLYCLLGALPLVEKEPPPGTFTIVNARQRMDRIFAFLIVPQLVVTLYSVWVAGPKFWPTLLCVPGMWLLMRFITPTREIRRLPEIESNGIKWIGLAFMALIVGLALSTLEQGLIDAVCGVVFVAAMIQFFRCASAVNRERQELWNEQAKTADARWRVALAEYEHSAP